VTGLLLSEIYPCAAFHSVVIFFIMFATQQLHVAMML